MGIGLNMNVILTHENCIDSRVRIAHGKIKIDDTYHFFVALIDGGICVDVASCIFDEESIITSEAMSKRLKRQIELEFLAIDNVS